MRMKTIGNLKKLFDIDMTFGMEINLFKQLLFGKIISPKNMKSQFVSSYVVR